MLFLPGLMRPFTCSYNFDPAMLRHYFTTSTRVLLRQQAYTLINTLGLAVSMGGCLLIAQYIFFELSYDGFHTQAPHLYRLTQTVVRHGENQGVRAYTTSGLGPTAEESIPEIASSVRVHPFEEGLIAINPENNVRHQENRMWYVDSNFLQLFDFPLKYGSRPSALQDLQAIVITEPIATRYFGSANPVGKTLRVSGGVLTADYVVTGVLESLPANSHLEFDFLMPIPFLLNHYGPYKDYDDGWDWDFFVTYVRLREGARPDVVSQKLDEMIRNNIGEKLASNHETWQIGLQPLTDIHLHSSFPKDLATNHGSIQNVQFFGIIALFILLIAWVNYVNLSTAQAMHRAKEVGVRKTLGAFRRQLIVQFMAESALINTLAAMLAVALAYLALPLLSHMVGKEVSFTMLQTPVFWGGFGGVWLIGILLSGCYPALALSAFPPIKGLKPIRVAPRNAMGLRRSLIVFQFVMSVLLISGTYLVYRQIMYMKNQELGFDTEKILVVNGPRVVIEGQSPAGLESLFETFKTEVTRHASITSACATSQIPSKGYVGHWNALRVGAPEQEAAEAKVLFTDTAFFTTYDLKFLARRAFPARYSQYEWLVMNEEAMKTYGFDSPEEAVNQPLQVFGDTLGILGVVKTIHWSSLKEEPEPILFTLDAYYGAFLSIKMNMTNIPESIAHIEKVFHAVYPDDPFHYFFLDDEFNRQYQADLQFGHLFSAFSLLAIFIAGLGLFALVSYSATRRTKEIGVRKVLGAKVGHLVLLLSREYLFLLLVAVGVAMPVVIVGGQAWLKNYAYRVGIAPDVLVFPGLLLLLLSVATVSYRTYAAARVNPVESLRNE